MPSTEPCSCHSTRTALWIWLGPVTTSFVVRLPEANWSDEDVPSVYVTASAAGPNVTAEVAPLALSSSVNDWLTVKFRMAVEPLIEIVGNASDCGPVTRAL